MLLSEEIADKIVLSGNIQEGDTVLEIGTGYGVLTGKLAALAKRVVSYEVDEAVYEMVRASLRGYSNIELILGDAFEKRSDVDFDVCVTNLPYSQSLKFVKWLCQSPTRFRSSIAMLQSEFVRKLLSAPASESYRAISVIAQLSFDMNSLFGVGPEVFEPMPRVTSEVMRFTPKAGADWPVLGSNRIAALNFLFSFRGRLLASALRKMFGNDYPRSFSKELVSRRIETLKLHEFYIILEGIEAAKAEGSSLSLQ
jgi:16S rRNA (adenine1518-N6/adenine1519-N6)-dimethyltransferase